jgi:protein phosphatase
MREARAGDRYLLCTDGLTGPVGRTETLLDALRIEDPQECVDRLVQLALKGGGPDNVTVIVADVVDESRGTGTPVVAGAAASAPQAPPPGIGDSAAARARAAEGRDVEQPRTTALETAPPRPRTSHRRSVLVGLVLLGLLLAGAGTGWAYVRSQYYVGVDDGRVAVFRGVTGSVLGVSLSDVEERTSMTVDSLSEIDGARLRKGIVAADRSDADRIVARLDEGARSEVEASPTPAPSPSPLPTPSAP